MPFEFRRGTVPGATLVSGPSPMPQECPKISPKKRAWHQPRRHVCIARFLLRSASHGVQRDRTRDGLFAPENALKAYLVPGWKARLSARHVWKMQTLDFGHPLLAVTFWKPPNCKRRRYSSARIYAGSSQKSCIQKYFVASSAQRSILTASGTLTCMH